MLQQPNKVDACIVRLLIENQQMTENEAWKICYKLWKEGNLRRNGTETKNN